MATTCYELLEFDEISDVKPDPGIYAWYLRTKIGAANLKSSEDTEKSILAISEYFTYPDAEMTLKAHLNLEMKGKLKHLNYGSSEREISSKVRETLQDKAGREVMARVFELAVPLLAAPLYIGVSVDLRQRLSQHGKLIQETIEVLDSEEVAKFDLEEEVETNFEKQFATRIASRGIDPNDLMVGVVYIPRDSETTRKSIESAETCLNRIFYPILGRR